MERNIYLSRQSGEEAGRLLMGDFPVCQHSCPDVRYRHQGFEQFARPYTPLMDITGSIFGGLAHDPRLRPAYEPGVFGRSGAPVSGGVSRAGARGEDSRFFGAGPSSRSVLYSNHTGDVRAFNRSLSLSSPSLEVGFASGPGGGHRESAIENNSSLMNRSRSFADRIMEQFSIVEREHSRLAERIHRSQSIYEQIQRNSIEFEGLFNNLYNRVQRRRHTQREASAGYEDQLRSPIAPDSVSGCDGNSHLSQRLCSRPRFVSEGDALSRANSVGFEGSFFTAQDGCEEVVVVEDEEEGEREELSGDEETEVIEFSLLSDEEVSEILSRRSADIMNRSSVVNREEIASEQSEYEDRDSENSRNGQIIVIDCVHGLHIHGHGHHSQDHGEAGRDEYQQGEREHSRGGGNGSMQRYDVDSSAIIRRVLNNIREGASQGIEGITMTGVPDEIQSSLPVSRFDLSKSGNLDDDKKMCLICLEEFKDGQEIRWLPCTHCFCRECITSWFDRGTACPICKDEVMSHFR